jgi:hypothetical protein
MNDTKYLSITLLLFLCCISLVSASSLPSLGIFKQDSTVTIAQVCSDATYINITSIGYPNSSTAVSNVEMNKNGGDYYYDFNSTNLLGRYDVRGISDGCTKSFATYFEITTNGKAQAEGIIVVVYTLIFILFIAFAITHFLVSIGHLIELDMDLVDASVMVTTYLAMWVFYYVSFEYLGNSLINEILEIAIKVGAITHVFLPLVGFLVSFIMINLKFKRKAKITY